MKDKELLNIIRVCSLSEGVLLNKIKTVENFLEQILELRNLHQKLSKELDEYLMPNYEVYEKEKLVKGIKWIREQYIEIRNICNNIGISVIFSDKDSEEFKKHIFAYYSIKNEKGEHYNIDGLIYYHAYKAKIVKNEIDNLEL